MSKSESATTETDLWPTADDPEPPEGSEEGTALTNYIADFVRIVWAGGDLFYASCWREFCCHSWMRQQPNIYTSTTTLMPPTNLRRIQALWACSLAGVLQPVLERRTGS